MTQTPLNTKPETPTYACPHTGKIIFKGSTLRECNLTTKNGRTSGISCTQQEYNNHTVMIRCPIKLLHEAYRSA